MVSKGLVVLSQRAVAVALHAMNLDTSKDTTPVGLAPGRRDPCRDSSIPEPSAGGVEAGQRYGILL
mgnify:CR=1 FL=1